MVVKSRPVKPFTIGTVIRNAIERFGLCALMTIAAYFIAGYVPGNKAAGVVAAVGVLVTATTVIAGLINDLNRLSRLANSAKIFAEEPAQPTIGDVEA